MKNFKIDYLNEIRIDNHVANDIVSSMRDYGLLDLMDEQRRQALTHAKQFMCKVNNSASIAEAAKAGDQKDTDGEKYHVIDVGRLKSKVNFTLECRMEVVEDNASVLEWCRELELRVCYSCCHGEMLIRADLTDQFDAENLEDLSPFSFVMECWASSPLAFDSWLNDVSLNQYQQSHSRAA